MYHKVKMKKYLSYLMVLALAFVGGLYLPAINANLIKADTYTYGLDRNSLEDDVKNFHNEMNTKTNEFLNILMSVPEPNLNYPLTGNECEMDNVSTLCLAVELNEIYTKYEAGLKSRTSELDSSVDTIEELAEATENTAKKNNFIETELMEALETMELSLAVYNEIQNIYPAHVELENTIDQLKDYRNNLAKVRDLVELYPSRFNGVSTNSCQ